MSGSLGKESEGSHLSLPVRCVRELDTDHPGQRAKYRVSDAEGTDCDLVVFRNSPVGGTTLESDRWYDLEDVKLASTTGRPELRAVGDTACSERSTPPVDDDAGPEIIWQYVCGDGTCQECFTRELVGTSHRQDVSKGDYLTLYDHTADVLYGPFEATSDVTTELESTAWDGRFPEQVRIDWDQLYRVERAAIPFKIGVRDDSGEYANHWRRADTDDILRFLEEEGTPVTVTDDGRIGTPDDADADQGNEDVLDEDGDDEDDNPFAADADEAESVRDVISLAEDDPTRSPVDILAEAPEPGERLIEAAISPELRPELYREALAHLVAGKNVVFYGPPGSGKTRCATRLGRAVCRDVHVETAHTEWTHQRVVGGFVPEGESFVESPGLFTEAAMACQRSLEETDHPDWLVIDELNRANLDEAFGEIFTLLDLTHRPDAPLQYGRQRVDVPLSFRVLATMNTKDRAQLFSLGYAFMRRFAFVNVPSLFTPDERPDRDPTPPETLPVEVHQHVRASRLVIERAVVEQFSTDGGGSADSPLGAPYLWSLFDAEAELDAAVEALAGHGGSHDFIDAILVVVQSLDDADIAEVGQGIVIDAIKFAIAYRFLFPDRADWGAVDTAVAAYVLPQLEEFMPTLRRDATLNGDDDARARFEAFVDTVRALNLPRTTARLETALETNQILG